MKEYETSRLQDACAAAFADIQSRDVIYGVKRNSIVLKAGQDNIIEHKLGYEWSYWILMRKSGAGDIYEASSTYDKTKFIGLRTSADVTISLWVG